MPVTLVDIEAQVLELAHDANQLQRSFVNELSNATQELHELVQIYLPSILPGAAAPPAPPPPPPPTPLATAVADRSSAFVRRHTYIFAGSALAVTAVGVGYVGLGPAGRRRAWEHLTGVGERGVQACRDVGELKRAMERPFSRDGSRLEAIVLLGADASPLGFPLARYLESAGYIVIASVSTTAASKALEKSGGGFIRALVLDPDSPDSVEPFVAATKSVVTMRFPLGSAGDPYATPASTPQITSIISLLSLALPASTTAAAVSLQATLHTPLAAITALLPQLQAPLPATLAPAALRAAASDGRRKAFLTRAVEKEVVVLVPVQGNLGSAAPGLAGLDVSNAAVRSAVRSLAAEVGAATTAETSRVKVNVMEVGFVSPSRTVRPTELGPRVRALAREWADWWLSWVRGGRQQSGFEVLERAVGQCVGVGGRWAPRFSLLPSRVSVWRVGAGSWTYSLLPAILPSQVFTSIIALQRRAGLLSLPLPPAPSDDHPAKQQSDASKAAGRAAALRAQAAAAAPSTPAAAAAQAERPRKAAQEDSDEDTSTDPGTDNSSGLASSGIGSLGDSWVHEGLNESA